MPAEKVPHTSGEKNYSRILLFLTLLPMKSCVEGVFFFLKFLFDYSYFLLEVLLKGFRVLVLKCERLGFSSLNHWMAALCYFSSSQKSQSSGGKKKGA